jgi:cytoskeletal protein CcmA (bactofilin family)
MFRSRRRRVAAPALVLLVATAGVALAQQPLEAKLRSGDQVIVAANETVRHDLYAVGSAVIIDGTVEGDLVAAGGDVRVTGSVTGDVLAAGGTVALAGPVRGDARVAAGQLTVAGQIAEDLVFAAGQASLTPTGRVGQDLIFSAGQVTLDGAVAGSIQGSASEYLRQGSVGGGEAVAIGEPEERRPEETTGDVVADALRHLVAVALFGGLALWLFPRALRATEHALRHRPLVALGAGLAGAVGYLIAFIVVVLLMVLLAIVLGILGFGALVAIDVISGTILLVLVSLAFFLVAAFLADAIVGLTLARLVAPRFAATRWQELAVLVAGSALVVLATSLPVVGGWLKLLVILLGLGALALAALGAWRARRTTTPVATHAPPPAPATVA